LRYDASLPRNGLPWEELLEPGALFDLMSKSFDGRGVIQLNHPLAESSFGRDEGFLTAIDYDFTKPIPAGFDNSSNGQLRKSQGGFSALDFHAQEVMNGTSTRGFQQYRAAWFSLLNQGIVRAGTANSDSHTLADEGIGYPRNLVFGGHSLVSFDPDRFNDDVRHGKMIGTNGPVILANIDGRAPSIDPFQASTAAKLNVKVSAMPWIPVSEVRILVNGVVKKSLVGAAITSPSDPFGTETVLRFEGNFSISDLLSGLSPESDAYIVVEAGLPLYPARDLDGNGLVDTTDNNGDGVINERDRDGLEEDATYKEPSRPKESDPRFHAQVVAPGHWSTSFTNPFLLDRGAPGFAGPGFSLPAGTP
ncbi:MAG: hypothetical protein KBF88_14860, partial [Polyangiaceae bacterium]|nr:hypothetical protein [Polyangiaceae bacterium]